MRTLIHRGNGSIPLRSRSWITVCVGVLLLGSSAGRAADCPGHPEALGTSRTIAVDPREHPRIGTMQYAQTLPLRDHEVVLTFDDGPLPKYSNQVLEILAAECVKATFFVIGRHAQANPEGVRKLAAAGHTIGTHTQNHPLSFQKMSIEEAEREINDGIASTSAALPDARVLTPFFRIPGLRRAEGVEDYLARRGIQVWSADFPADDWRHIPSERVYEIAMQRLEAKGKGILLLHDIQPPTVEALPKILREMKARGYHIVHVVPATAERPATPTEPQEWRSRPRPEDAPVARWPKVPRFVFANSDRLPAPAWSSLSLSNDRTVGPELWWERAGRGLAVSPRPGQITLAQQKPTVALPIPDRDLFKISAYVPRQVAVAHRAAPESRRHGKVVAAAHGYAAPALAPPKATTRARGHLPAHHQGEKRIPAGPAVKKQAAEQAGKAAQNPTRLASLKKR